MIQDNHDGYRGGGICLEMCEGALVEGCLIRNNETASGWGFAYGAGIYIGWSDGVVAVNNILWGDIGEYGDDEIYVDHGSLSVTFSDVMGGWSGEGNIDADPLFISDRNYHLRPGSPCIDAGTDAGVYTDIDGQSRPWGAGFDMGSDELSTEPCSTIASTGYQFFAFYLLPALALAFLGRRFLRK